MIEKKKEIALLKCERWLSSDKSVQTMIDIAELELNELQSIPKGDLIETKAHLEKIFSFQIDMKKTSVNEFYTYLKIASKETKGNG